MQYSQEHLKTMVYAEFGGQTECIMGNWKIENVIPRIRSLRKVIAKWWKRQSSQQYEKPICGHARNYKEYRKTRGVYGTRVDS